MAHRPAKNSRADNISYDSTDLDQPRAQRWLDKPFRMGIGIGSHIFQWTWDWEGISAGFQGGRHAQWHIRQVSTGDAGVPRGLMSDIKPARSNTIVEKYSRCPVPEIIVQALRLPFISMFSFGSF